VLNALDLVHFIMGHHQLVQPKMGRSWGSGRGHGGSCPLPPIWSRPWESDISSAYIVTLLHCCCILLLVL